MTGTSKIPEHVPRGKPIHSNAVSLRLAAPMSTQHFFLYSIFPNKKTGHLLHIHTTAMGVLGVNSHRHCLYHSCAFKSTEGHTTLGVRPGASQVKSHCFNHQTDRGEMSAISTPVSSKSQSMARNPKATSMTANARASTVQQRAAASARPGVALLRCTPNLRHQVQSPIMAAAWVAAPGSIRGKETPAEARHIDLKAAEQSHGPCH